MWLCLRFLFPVTSSLSAAATEQLYVHSETARKLVLHDWVSTVAQRRRITHFLKQLFIPFCDNNIKHYNSNVKNWCTVIIPIKIKAPLRAAHNIDFSVSLIVIYWALLSVAFQCAWYLLIAYFVSSNLPNYMRQWSKMSVKWIQGKWTFKTSNS